MASLTSATHFMVPSIAAYTGNFFKSKCNPLVHEAEATSHDWFEGYGIYSGSSREKFYESRFCLLAAMCYPDADMEHLRPAMDFFLWTFAFDEMADLGEFSPEKLKIAVDITMNALRNPDAPQPDLTIVAVLQSYAKCMRVNGGRRAIEHFIEALDEYNQAIIVESVRKSENHIETIDEYIAARRDTSGFKQTFAMLEYAHCLDLPDEVYRHPIINELAMAGGDILAWANDVYSFPAELAHGQLHNFIYVVMQNNQVDLQEASDYVNERIQTRVQEYVALKARLPSFGPHLDDQVARYLQGIEYVVQGCIEWYTITPRYLGKDGKEARETGIVKLRSPVKKDQIMAA